MNGELTYDAQLLLKFIYAQYMCRRKEGFGRVEANYFDDSRTIQQTYFSAMNEEDITDICFELSRAGLLSCQEGDSLANLIALTTDGLVYGEEHFGRDCKALSDWMGTIRGSLPFFTSE